MITYCNRLYSARGREPGWGEDMLWEGEAGRRGATTYLANVPTAPPPPEDIFDGERRWGGTGGRRMT